MKSSKWIIWAIVLVVVISVIALVVSKRPPAETQAVELEKPQPLLEESQPEVPPPAEEVAIPEPEPPVEAPPPAPKKVHIKPTQVLAEVNGVAITLKDLMPVSGSTPPELSIASDEYQVLLQSAIERKLTFQVARSKRVVLSKEQTLQLEKSRRLARVQKPELSTEAAGEYVAQANFDSWKATTAMMQNSLFAASEDLARFVPQDQVDEYFKEHRNEYGALPEAPDDRHEARKRIDAAIRLQLAPGEDPEYQRQLQLMIDDIVSKADIRYHIDPAGG